MQAVEREVKDAYASLPFGFRVRIIGADLEADGITRNQQVRDVDVKNKSVADVLTQIVVVAQNTGKPPSDAAQKLIWVVGPDPDDASKKTVLVTTRAAAAKKKYAIPSVFGGS